MRVAVQRLFAKALEIFWAGVKPVGLGAIGLLLALTVFPEFAAAQQPRRLPKKVRPSVQAASEQQEAPPAEGASEFPKLTFDLGASLGQTNQSNGTTTNYSEFNLGINLFFNPYINWRNSIFGRFGGESVYGLDTGLRAAFELNAVAFAINTFAGAGYRFMTLGTNAPFGEVGLQLSLLGLKVGGGVKVIMNSAVQAGAKNDTQYFLILSGSGSL